MSEQSHVLALLSPAFLGAAARSDRHPDCAAFRSRLSAMSRLSVEDVALIQGLGRASRAHPARTEIWDGAAPGAPRVMISGWACQQRLLNDGRRQIVGFLLPGDAVGSLEPPEPASDMACMALTAVVTADAGALVAAVAGGDPAREGLARAVRLLARHETALLRDQVVRLGRQTAYERLVHLMLELHARSRLAGLAAEADFAMPLTQDVLADALGLSIVHVNRTLQQVRRDGLLEIRSGRVRIIDMRLMQTVADWVPAQAAMWPAGAREAGQRW